MQTECRVVNNRVFLLGLDELYRQAMIRHEQDELLRCARETADALSVPPADVPIEGYYVDDERLTEYFRLVRALQLVPRDREREVDGLAVFHRLKDVTASPIYGTAYQGEFLLPVGIDCLTQALDGTFPKWTVENVTRAAYEIAAASTEFSLVALAALSRDAVVLASLRESVVLYAGLAFGFMGNPDYAWEVDDDVQERATRFVETFNALFDEHLPLPMAANAREFWDASSEWRIVGRCVRIGVDNPVSPVRHYHWAVDRHGESLVVRDFWDTKVWTTAEYRKATEEGEFDVRDFTRRN